MSRGPRRLWALVQGLPADASTWREDKPAWTAVDERQAQILEAIERCEWSFVVALSGADIAPPERIAHPDRPEPLEPEKPKIETDPAAIREFLTGSFL